MKVCNLSSGSDGNLTYIESPNAKILIDIGLTCKETELRLARLGISGDEINGIFITHEHQDHIKGLEVFANKFKTPVFVHEKGLNSLLSKIHRNINIITFGDDDIKINDLVVSNVELPHDVVRCTGYIIKENEKKVSIITDLGHTTSKILQNILGSNLVFLEANHDPVALKENLNYPYFLKQRIGGANGHLSNEDCAKAILTLVGNGTKQVVLSHLSTENNSPEFAYNYIKEYLENYGVIEGQDICIDVATTKPKSVFVI